MKGATERLSKIPASRSSPAKLSGLWERRAGLRVKKRVPKRAIPKDLMAAARSFFE